MEPWLDQQTLNDANWYTQLLLRMYKLSRMDFPDNLEMQGIMGAMQGKELSSYGDDDLWHRFSRLLRCLGLLQHNCPCQRNGVRIKTTVYIPDEFGLFGRCFSCGRKTIWSRIMQSMIELPDCNGWKHISFTDKDVFQAGGLWTGEDAMLRNCYVEGSNWRRAVKHIPGDLWMGLASAKDKMAFWNDHLSGYTTPELKLHP